MSRIIKIYNKYISLRVILLLSIISCLYSSCIMDKQVEKRIIDGEGGNVYLDMNIVSKGGGSTSSNTVPLNDTILKPGVGSAPDTLVIDTYKYAKPPYGLSAGEYNIKNAIILVFDGDTFETSKHVSFPTPSESCNVVIKVMRTENEKQVFAFLNILDSTTISQIHKVRKVEDINDIEFSMDNIMLKEATDTSSLKKRIIGYNENPKDFVLPAFGKTNVEPLLGLKINGEYPVDLKVDRAVARVDVFFERTVYEQVYMDTSTVFYADGFERGFISPAKAVDNSITYNYWAKIGPDPKKEIKRPSQTSKTTTDTAGVRTTTIIVNRGLERYFSYYLPEINLTNNQNPLTFGISNVLFPDNVKCGYSVKIGTQPGNMLSKIERNRVYRIDCRIVGKNPENAIAVISALDWYEITEEVFVN